MLSFVKIATLHWQREKDSNPHKQSQSLSCYPYTIPLDLIFHRPLSEGPWIIIAWFYRLSSSIFRILEKPFSGMICRPARRSVLDNSAGFVRIETETEPREDETMGFLHLFIRSDINAGIRKWQADPAGVLVDVREPEEYVHRRIPGSENLPLSVLETAPAVYPDKDTPLYLYCYSGARSGQAAAALRRMGYTCVSDIGGIKGYTGATERGPKGK